MTAPTGNFGRPLGRFGVKNPILTPGRAIGGRNVWFAHNYVDGTAGFSTATTGIALYAYSGLIATVGLDTTSLFLWGNAKFTHSAGPGASIDVGMFVDYGIGTGLGLYWAYFGAMYIASASLWTNLPLFGAYDMNSPAGAISPGLHTVGYVVVNNTVGTLTMATNGFTKIASMEVPWKIV